MRIMVRAATPEDITWLLTQLKEFSAFYGTKKPLFGDEEYSRAKLLELIDQHLFLVAIEDLRGPVGFICGLSTPHFMNPDIQLLAEMFWWVVPECRGSKAGALLLNKFIQWGKENADWITFTLEHHSPVRDHILLKRGFKYQERAFLLEVQ